MDKNVLRELSYGVYVVSTMCQDKSTGCIANSLIQVTHDTIAVSINHINYTNECINNCGKFAISVLGVDVDDDVIPIFGFRTGREVSKFDGFKTKNIRGIDVLEDSVAYILCDVIDKMETETHTIFLGRIIDGEKLKNDIPMTYTYYHKVKKGMSPKNAPTYIDEAMQKDCYKCKVCNYIYTGDINEEPDSYVCPICKQQKSVFEKC